MSTGLLENELYLNFYFITFTVSHNMPKFVLVAISYSELGGVYRFVGKVMGVKLMGRYSLNEFP